MMFSVVSKVVFFSIRCSNRKVSCSRCIDEIGDGIFICFFSVECPVCSVSVSQHFINKHLDSCLTRGEKKESLRR